jgi:hypothetical protein
MHSHLAFGAQASSDFPCFEQGVDVAIQQLLQRYNLELSNSACKVSGSCYLFLLHFAFPGLYERTH